MSLVSVTSRGARAVADLKRLREAAARSLAKELAQVVLDVGTPAVLDGARRVRGSLTMSNQSKAKFRKLDAKPILRARGRRAEAEIQGVPRGAWTLVNDGARPHEILPRKRRAKAFGPAAPRGHRTKKSRHRALRLANGEFRLRVNHPGTRGDRSWDKGMKAAEPKIDKAVRAELARRLER